MANQDNDPNAQSGSIRLSVLLGVGDGENEKDQNKGE